MISAVWRSLKNGDYPIITLEWRRMMRGKLRFRLLLTAAAVISGVGLFATFAELASASTGTTSRLGGLPELGMFASLLLLLIQQAVLWLVIPLYTARSIAAQREAGSLQMIAVTPMRSRFIVGQIMAVAMALALAVAVVSLPALVALDLRSLFHGRMGPFFPVGPGLGMLPLAAGGSMGQLWFPLTAAFYASIGLYCSSTCAKAQSATFLTYALIVLLGRIAPSALFIVPFLLRLWGPWFGDPATLVTLAILMRVVYLVLTVLLVWMAITRLDRIRRGIGGVAC